LNNPEDPELGNGLAEERKVILMPFQNHAMFIVNDSDCGINYFADKYATDTTQNMP